MDRSGKLPLATPDELPAPLAGEWGRQKHLRAWIFAEIFAKGMRKIPVRVYLDLFSSAGKWRTRGKPEEWNLGSALLALNIEVPFSHYIFCDESEENIRALRARVQAEHPGTNAQYFTGQAERLVDDIIAALPRGSRRLTFCLVDPWDLSLDFSLIRALAQGGGPIDFMVLIAAQMDGQRNLTSYESFTNRKIDRFLNDPHWRDDWERCKEAGEGFAHFLVRRFTDSMVGLGYIRPEQRDIHTVRLPQRGTPIYVLAFYSKHPLGYKFWREALKYAPEQADFLDQLGD
jgi:three-Cys-motif partner protein